MHTTPCATQLRDYLQHRTTRAALVDWAEHAMMDEDFEEEDLNTIRDITSRLGLADVREFGLTWEDFESFLSHLGYQAKETSFRRNSPSRHRSRSTAKRRIQTISRFEFATVWSTKSLFSCESALK